MIAISIVILIIALILFFLAWKRREEAKRIAQYADDRVAQSDKMQADAREAMRRNGAARLEIDKRVSDFDINHKLISVNYVETDQDVEKYPSETKRTAVIKSRLAHNIGYRILSQFPDADTWTDDDGARVFSYRFKVAKEK